MLKATLNEKEIEVQKGNTLENVLNQYTPQDPVFAVAINGEFVPRSCYSSTVLKEGDKVHIVVPMEGG